MDIDRGVRQTSAMSKGPLTLAEVCRMIYTPLAVCMIGGRVLVTPPERVAYNMATGPGPKKRDHSALLGVDVGEQLVTRGWARCIGTGKPRPSGQWRDIYQLTAAGLEVAANVDFRVIFKDHFA